MESRLCCFIIDDEPLALGLLESYVQKTPFLQLTGKFSSALSAMEAMQQSPPDVVFLDIQMAELNGMEFARMIPEKTAIVFTTAFQQYALEGYKVNALDYLLKPFSYSEFLSAANKALRRQKPLSIHSEEPRSIFVKADYKILQIDLDRILYIEGLKDYLKIHLENPSASVVTHLTMKAMEEMLSAAGRFIRVHRSFIVQGSKIRIIERSRIVFGKEYIPISDSYREAVESFIGKSLS